VGGFPSPCSPNSPDDYLIHSQYDILNSSNDFILQITDNIIENPELIVTEKNSQTDVIPIFNFDNDIIDWFKSICELTNNEKDIIKIKDIYDKFKESIHFRNMTNSLILLF
jgi:hypothetical protein